MAVREAGGNRWIIAVRLLAAAGVLAPGVAGSAALPAPLISAAAVAPAAPGSSGAPDTPAAPGDARFAALEREYVIRFLGRNPALATYLGAASLDPALQEVDATLRDPSAAALADEDRELRHLRSRFLAIDPRTLSTRRRIDRDVALAQIDFVLRVNGPRHAPERALDTYVDEPLRAVDGQLLGFEPQGDGHFGSAEDWARVIARVRAIPAYLARAEAQLRAGVRAGRTPDWRVLREYGLEATQADREYFAVVLPRIANERVGTANRGALLWDLTPAAARAADAYARFRSFILVTFFADDSLGDEMAVKPAFRGDRFALGAAEYDWALHNNLRGSVSSARLYEDSLPLIAATRTTMAALARAIAKAHGWSAPADDGAAVRSVFALLGRDAPRSDGEMIRWYRDTGMRLVAYGRRAGLFDVPEDYRLEVSFAPEPLRAAIEGAAYYPAPAFNAAGTGRLFVSPTGDDPDALARNNRAALADLAAREGFPGRDWHFEVMRAAQPPISLVRWLTPVEDSTSAGGWACYAEALLAEPQPRAPSGFYTPEEHLYELQGELLRDLRVRIDTGLHTQHMAFEDAVDLLAGELGGVPGSCRDPAALTDETRRASCDRARQAVLRQARRPTEAVTCRLGREQIEALRAAARNRLGTAYSDREFHLALMRQGTIPASYFGAPLLDALARGATDSRMPNP